MSSVPPVVVHARKTQMKARAGVVVGLVAVAVGVVAAVPFVTSLPPWAGLVLLLLWSGGLGIGLGAVSSHLSTQARWTVAILDDYDKAEVARLVDRQVDCYGDIELEPNRTLVSIRKLSLRIEALAGKREWIRESVHKARMAARQLAAERRALSKVEREDVDFDAARALIDSNLQNLSKRLLALFEQLVSQTSDAGLDALADAVSRVAAETEVAHPGRAQLRVAR